MDGTIQDFSALERASGKLTLGFKRRGAKTALDTLYQEGCLKARFPRWQEAAKSGYLINTTGGIADGDQLQTHITLAAHTSAVLTTQAAERVYRARAINAPASVSTQISVARGAQLFWIPQETILFDGAAIRRAFDFDVAIGGTLVAAETLVLGRTAMKERVQAVNLFDRWRVRQGGKLVFADGFHLEDDSADTLSGAALLGGNTAVASLLILSSCTGAVVDAVRAVAAPEGVVFGCSLRNPVVLARFASADAAQLQATVNAALSAIDHIMNGDKPVTPPILSRRHF